MLPNSLNATNMQPTHDETQHDLPDSNTLGGTTSTGAGPNGEPANIPAPETTGLGSGDLDEADEVARRINERKKER